MPEQLGTLFRVSISGDYINTEHFNIIRRTPCGAWIRVVAVNGLYRERFVNLNAVKQYASETEPEAMDCFLARKRRHLHILRGQIKHIEHALNMIKTGNFKHRSICDFAGIELF